MASSGCRTCQYIFIGLGKSDSIVSSGNESPGVDSKSLLSLGTLMATGVEKDSDTSSLKDGSL